MQLLTNEIDVESVRRESSAGQDFLVAPVVLMRAMQLNGGYVPTDEVAAAAERWNGVPIPVTHPMDGTRPISIRSENADVPVIGFVDNVTAESGGELLRGELWIDIQAASQTGDEAERVVTRLGNGDAVEVSTGYLAQELPAGMYDGEHREEVVGNLQPDHLAVLPSEKGKCSIADGCGAGAPVAAANGALAANNQSLYIPTIADDGPASHPEDDGPQDTQPMQANQIDYSISDAFDAANFSGDDYTDDEWDSAAVVSALPNPSDEPESAPGILDETHALVPQEEEAREDKSNWKAPFRSSPEGPANTRALVAIRSAVSGGRGGFDDVDRSLLDDLDGRAEAMLEEAPADLFGGDGEANANTISNVVNWLASVMNSTQTNGAESLTDADDTEDTTMGDKTQELVENHGFNADNLPDEDTECFDRIYSQFADGAGDSGGNDGGSDAQSENEIMEELQAIKSEMVTEEDVEAVVAANATAEKKAELAEEIVANSADYEDTEEVREDFPTVESLRAKRQQVTASGGMPGRGFSSDFEANGDDDLDSVSAGVFE